VSYANQIGEAVAPYILDVAFVSVVLLLAAFWMLVVVVILQDLRCGHRPLTLIEMAAIGHCRSPKSAFPKPLRLHSSLIDGAAIPRDTASHRGAITAGRLEGYGGTPLR
jgi:hypothetical protein